MGSFHPAPGSPIMAAPHIPNLSTFRSARGNSSSSGRGRGRGRGRGLLQANFPPPSSVEGVEEDIKTNQAAAKVKIIQSTDQDASISRWSAVQAGYLHDPFAHFFTPSPAPRRFPIINRGTYVRTTTIDNLVSLFLSQSPSIQKQIISLGAGSDTRFFRLASSSSPSPLIYHELDFASNTAAKIATISNSPALIQRIQSPITVVEPARDTLHSPNYHIHPTDLRTLDPSSSSSPSPSPMLQHINPNLPTLLISECCLCYLPPEAADSVITFFTRHLFPSATPLGMLLYEPIKPSDAFGRVMVANLAVRGIELHTLARYDSLDAQRERLQKYGFVGGGGGGGGGEGGGGVRAKDIDECWEEGVSVEEKRRVALLEMVDEVEEWKLLAQHYCVAWGWREREVGGGAVGVEMAGEVGEEGSEKKKAEEDESDDNDNDNDVWKKWRTET